MFVLNFRSAVRLGLSLTGLLGLSWLTGFFTYIESEVFACIFTITNGLQGVVILLSRCLFNESFRAALRDRWERRKAASQLEEELQAASPYRKALVTSNNFARFDSSFSTTTDRDSSQSDRDLGIHNDMVIPRIWLRSRSSYYN